jgi:superfamily II DNA or RNA helicase
MEDNPRIESDENELRKTREENERLKAENRRLKALLESFALRPASSLTTPPTDRKDKAITRKPRLSKPPVSLAPPETCRESSEPRSVGSEDSTSAPNEKIALFRSLFRGREDVYAVRWESRKGRSGYSPACAHEWDPLLCRKPCAKCKNGKYIPISDEVICDHVLGKQTVGIYPLLQDETCWFLAADFDKEGWQDDARAFLDVCREFDAVAALERSRSGRGGHVWIFFEEAIPAALARKLGSAILTRSMDKRHLMGLDSYDRFFPSQDTMPKGGFGNLIALPLQGAPGKQGNSLFLGEDFTPYPRQWQFLASVRRVPRSRVERIVADASRRGQVIGVRLSMTDEIEDEDPWTLPPSRRRAEKPLQGPLPKAIGAVLGNLLYVEKDGLSSQLMNRLVRLAAFQNPEFYNAQAMRLSTFGKPRVIGCAEEFPRHIALPRGCLDDLECFLASHGIALALRDERYAGTPSAFEFQGTLQAEQENAVREMLRFDTGVLVAPTGFGKTVIAARLIAERKTNAIVLVHRRSLLDQWRERLAMFLGMPTSEIGTFSGERKKPGGAVDVALMQSLCRKGEVHDVIADYGHVIVDECHHIPAFTFERVVRQARAKYVLGLTATPIRKDGHHPIIIMQCGPIRVRIRPKDVAERQSFRRVVVMRSTEFALPVQAAAPTIQDIYTALVNDTARNDLILGDINKALECGRYPLVLTERTDHLEYLAAELRRSVRHVIVMRGGMGKKQRAAVLEQINSVPAREERVILATGRYAGEGFDDARLDTLFLAMPISWRGTLQQYVGRLHRACAGKHEVRVYDYVDRQAPVLMRMLAKRLKGYRAMGYVTDDQLELI